MTGVYKLNEVSCKRVDTPKLKRNGSLSKPRVTEKVGTLRSDPTTPRRQERRSKSEFALFQSL